MKIRRCIWEDVDAVYKLEKISFPHPYPKIFFYSYLSEIFFVLVDNNEIVGYIIADAKRNLVVSVAVHPSYRRRGYGKMLMENAIKYMEGDVILQVRKSNEGAIKFYEKLGFTRKGELKRYYADGEDAIVMIKRRG